MAYHFNNRIEIIKKEIEDDFMPGSGTVIETIIAKPWADVKTMKGSEYNEYYGTFNKTPIRFIIRYREGITTKHLVRYNGNEYNIKSAENDNGMNRTITLFAESIK